MHPRRRKRWPAPMRQPRVLITIVEQLMTSAPDETSRRALVTLHEPMRSLHSALGTIALTPQPPSGAEVAAGLGDRAPTADIVARAAPPSPGPTVWSAGGARRRWSRAAQVAGAGREVVVVVDAVAGGAAVVVVVARFGLGEGLFGRQPKSRGASPEAAHRSSLELLERRARGVHSVVGRPVAGQFEPVCTAGPVVTAPPLSTDRGELLVSTRRWPGPPAR